MPFLNFIRCIRYFFSSNLRSQQQTCGWNFCLSLYFIFFVIVLLHVEKYKPNSIFRNYISKLNFKKYSGCQKPRSAFYHSYYKNVPQSMKNIKPLEGEGRVNIFKICCSICDQYDWNIYHKPVRNEYNKIFKIRLTERFKYIFWYLYINRLGIL